MISLKTPAEIAILREGGRRLALILKELETMVKPGVSSADLEMRARELCTHYEGKPAFRNYTPKGAERPFPAALCLTVNDGVVHGIPHEAPYTIEEGDLVTLDMGLTYKGLITDAAITVCAGDINNLDKKGRTMLEAGAKCLEAGIVAAEAGKKTGDIGAAIEKALEYYHKTFGFNFAEGLGGHGVGHKVHEDPFVPNFGRPNQGVILEAGLVIAIEPIINEKGAEIVLEDDGYTIKTVDGGRSVHFEHTVVITENGAEILTQI
jgi:methionyl aminopeptidase